MPQESPHQGGSHELPEVLREDQWERINDLLCGKSGDVGRTGDHRRFIEAVMWYWSHRGPLALHADTEWLMIDATIIRACQHAACAKGQQTQALGRCRVGFTTKLHAVCECVVQFAPVHHDGRRTASFYTQTQALLGGIHAHSVLADKGYEANEMVTWIQR